jgi:hypothetical protein
MSPKESTALRLDTDLLEAMRELKARKGVPVTTQIEMAVREWLKREHGLSVKAPSRRSAKQRKG